MKNTYVLEMLNDGKIEELKKMLQEEIYKDSLKNQGDAKLRFSAMKRYFKYVDGHGNISCELPCESVKVHGELYNSFCCGYTFALTKESLGTLERIDKTKTKYFDMEKLADFSNANHVEKVNIDAILAESKSRGYKYKKTEFDVENFKYVWKYRDAVYRIGFLDQAYSVIADGEEAEVYYKDSKGLLLIKTSIGVACILPFIKSDKTLNGKIIIESEEN